MRNSVLCIYNIINEVFLALFQNKLMVYKQKLASKQVGIKSMCSVIVSARTCETSSHLSVLSKPSYASHFRYDITSVRVTNYVSCVSTEVDEQVSLA